MAAIDTFQLIGDLAAGVAAVAAATGLYYARQTVREARTERVSAELGRLARRLEWIGETVEHVDRMAEDDLHMRPMGETWRRGCRLLAQGFVGLEGRLPQTAQLMYCGDAYTARSVAVRAREEVGTELAALARSQVEHADPAQDAGSRRLPHWAAGLGALWRQDGQPPEGQRPARRRTVKMRLSWPRPGSGDSDQPEGPRRSQHRLTQ